MNTITKSLRRIAPVASLALMVMALGGCKGGCGKSSACAPPCPPPCAPPSYAPAYPPPPPPVAYAPPSSPVPNDGLTDTERAELDTLRQTTAMSREQAQRERQLREAAEAQAREMESKWRAAAAAPAAAPGEAEAARFAESLRTRCDAEIVQNGSTVTIRMYDSFRPGSKDLKGDVSLATTLQAAAAALAEAPAAHVAVVGHSDTTPIKKSPWPDNTALSRARADTVARVLAENGVRHPIAVEGRGESEPIVYPETTKADQARNRRVEILVAFS
jgi:flagellar motor protein MotB